LARLRRLHRRRWLRMMRARRLRRRMMRRFHVRKATFAKRRLMRAQRRVLRLRQKFNILKRKIIDLIYQIRHTPDQNSRNSLLIQLRALIRQSKGIRKTIVKSAVGQTVNMKKLSRARRARALIKAAVKRQAKILARRKLFKAVRVARRKINLLKRRIRFNHKRFRRVSARIIKRVCRRFRLSRSHCHKVAKKLHHKIKRIARFIAKRYRKRQARIRAMMRKRMANRLVKKTVKGVAKKFERNYHTMGKYRDILNLTCKMDPANCNFFRRSFGDMVPIL